MSAQSKAASAIVLVMSLAVVGLGSLTGDPVVTGSTGAGGVTLLAAGGGSPAAAKVAGLGLVEPEGGTIDLAAQMPGVIAAVHVREGDRIRKGDVLAELVNEDLKAKVAQSEAVLVIRKADLKRIRNGPRAEEIRKAEAQLREEESNLKLLQLQYQRRKSLAQAGAVSAESYNTAASSLAVSQQRRDAAMQALEILRKGSRPEEIEAAEGEVSLAEHQLAEARATLAKSYLRANIDGVVLRRYREPGEALTSQTATPIVQIADISRLVVRTQVDEDEIGPLKVGQPAQITAASTRDRSYRGHIVRISPRLGAKTISGTGPTERRDTRVLDVIVGLDEPFELPINLRVDVVIDTGRPSKQAAAEPAAPAAPGEGVATVATRIEAVTQPMPPELPADPASPQDGGAPASRDGHAGTADAAAIAPAAVAEAPEEASGEAREPTGSTGGGIASQLETVWGLRR